MPRGFILQPTYRIESARPVVLLYGKLESGRTFLVRETRCVPHFYIRQDDIDTAKRLGARIVAGGRPRVTMAGEPVVRVETALPREVPALRARLVAAGVACFEADVRFALRPLIDLGIRGTVEIRGRPRASAAPGVDEVYENPDLSPVDFRPVLSVLSVDIETDLRAARVLSVALHGCGASDVLLLTPPGYACPPGARGFPDERRLLEALVRRVGELDPDVLTGWNVVDFDLAVLGRRASRLGVRLCLGRGPEPMRILPPPFPRASSRVDVPGRVVLDGIDLLRGAFLKFESYSLQAVSQKVLGRGKTMTGSDRGAQIVDAFESDRARFVEYNLNDARLVSEILDRLRLIDLTVRRSRLTGMPPDRVAASIASFDFLYLSELGRRGIVAPGVGERGATTIEAGGGHVLESRPGLYRNVLVLDFRSLYPSVIRTFQIDPLGYLPSASAEDDALVAPNGAAFRRRPGILPGILDSLVPQRQRAKDAGDTVASQAIKILMNSFYGVLGTPGCRFARPELANAITSFGREILLWSKARIEATGLEVLYGDTDSLFVLSDRDDPAAARRRGARLVKRLNQELAIHVRDRWRVASHLELEFEKLYLRLLLPVVRHGTAGARKRYAGLVETAGGTEVVFTGMEVVRRDWTELARRTQRELYEKLFADRPVVAYLRQVVDDLRAGRSDGGLIYRKALRKPLADYTASRPPHVVAARKMKTPPGRVVRYVITGEGPEPVGQVHAPIDHEHYVQRQIRPVAEPVLDLLGLDFDRVIGDDRQLSLF